ncbi:hypothetical protein ANOM_008004, partial [Aspergillus nomiae NRRL 13137]
MHYPRQQALCELANFAEPESHYTDFTLVDTNHEVARLIRVFAMGWRPPCVPRPTASYQGASSQLKTLVGVHFDPSFVFQHSLTEVDKIITSGLGPRWALRSPIMTKTLRGGGDFNYFLDHLGPAFDSWLS